MDDLARLTQEATATSRLFDLSGKVALVVGGWFLAHRHGELRGVVAASASNGDQKTATQSP